jgi:tetratricopeptide (TPR) repeat protein
LAVLAADMGDLAEAERQWREVVREAPQYRQGWRGLAETLARSGNIAAAYSVADQLVQDDDLRVEGLLIKSRAAVRLGRLDVALTALNQAATIAPDDRETLGSRCQFLFEHGSADEAESALRTLLDRDPGDASAYHNLGTLLMRLRRHHEAVKALEHSLSLRPDHAATHLNLGYALKDSGQIDQAVLAWKQALRLAPNDLAARQELARLGSI